MHLEVMQKRHLHSTRKAPENGKQNQGQPCNGNISAILPREIA